MARRATKAQEKQAQLWAEYQAQQAPAGPVERTPDTVDRLVGVLRQIEDMAQSAIMDTGILNDPGTWVKAGDILREKMAPIRDLARKGLAER